MITKLILKPKWHYNVDLTISYGPYMFRPPHTDPVCIAVCMEDWRYVITAPTDILALNDARPSTDFVIAKLIFLSLSILDYHFFLQNFFDHYQFGS